MKLKGKQNHYNVKFKIKSDAPEEKLQELVELAKKRSPVCDIISHPTPVNVSLEKRRPKGS